MRPAQRRRGRKGSVQGGGRQLTRFTLGEQQQQTLSMHSMRGQGAHNGGKGERGERGLTQRTQRRRFHAHSLDVFVLLGHTRACLAVDHSRWLKTGPLNTGTPRRGQRTHTRTRTTATTPCVRMKAPTNQSSSRAPCAGSRRAGASGQQQPQCCYRFAKTSRPVGGEDAAGAAASRCSWPGRRMKQQT